MKTRSVEDRIKGMARQLAYHREQLQNARDEATNAKQELREYERSEQALAFEQREKRELENQLQRMVWEYEKRIKDLEERAKRSASL